MVAAFKSNLVDIALVAIEAELSAAVLSAEIISRILYYTPKPEHYEAVALKVRVWAAQHGCRIIEANDGMTDIFTVYAEDNAVWPVVRVYKPLTLVTDAIESVVP